MKRKLILITLAALLLTSCSSQKESFEGSDFKLSYPTEYKFRKAATQFAFETDDDDETVALIMHRYLANDTDEFIAAIHNVGHNSCEVKRGGKRYGGYKAYTVFGEACELSGDLVTNKKGRMMLFIETEDKDKKLNRMVKKSFKFL